MNQLTPKLRDQVLAYLKVAVDAPSVELLDRLMAAYARTVPWESASRIAKRHQTSNQANCPRFPDEFWHSAMTLGTGGTCYESNYALVSLLTSLGFDAYLTVNNMGESVGVHSATVVCIGAARWLVDAGIPIHAALPLDPIQETVRVTPLLTYTVRPEQGQEDVYTIFRAPHPVPEIFTLIDKPISEDEYRAVTERDYGDNGLFLDRVILNKVIADQAWRFNSQDSLYHVQRFSDGLRYDMPFEGDTAEYVSAHFGIAIEVVRDALAALNLS